MIGQQNAPFASAHDGKLAKLGKRGTGTFGRLDMVKGEHHDSTKQMVRFGGLS